jgi:hypothetical protein
MQPDDMLLNVELWKSLPLDILVAYNGDNGDEVRVLDLDESTDASQVYRPVDEIPWAILVRTSDSEKRFTSKLKAVLHSTHDWGSIHLIAGHNGSSVGLILEIPEARFCGAHTLPDIVHFVTCTDGLPEDAVMKSVFTNKVIRIFRLGPEDDSAPHDVMLTTKARWFRARCNPKSLGFSKEER